MSAPQSLDRPLAGVHVLVVDDDPDSREMLAAWFRLAGARVMLAASAEIALEIVTGDGLDLVITDVGTPGHDGRWLLHQLRHRAPRVLVVVVTRAAMDDPDDAFDAAYLKPVNPWRLCVELGGLIRRQRPR